MKNSLMERQSRRWAPRNWFLVWSTAVLLLAALMRLVLLQDVPPGLSQDEVLNADVVSFIRQGYHTLFFREGYGHEPLYHYWSVPFQILFGDNVLSIGLPAVFLGLLLVALTMRWVRREFGPFTAVAAGIGLAISWWPIIFSRVGLRPVMEPVLLLIFAWFWPRRPWLAGLFLGLTVYTYTGARVLFLLPILLALYWLMAGRWAEVPRAKLLKWQVPQPLASSLIVLFVGLLVALPLAIALRADPTLQQRVQQLEGPLTALQQGDLQPILTATLATLGVFSFNGDPRWTYSLPGRALFDPFTALFFYGGLLLAILRFKRPPYALAIIWLIVGLIPSAVTPQAPSTVRLVGALPVVYLLPALALTWLWDRSEVGIRAGNSLSRLIKGSLIILFVLLILLNLSFTVRDGFIRWPQELETRIKYQSLWQEVGNDLQNYPEGGLVIADGFYRPITADSLRRNMGYPLQARWVQTGSEVAGALVFPYEGDGRLIVPEFAAPDPFLMDAAGIDPSPLFRSEQNPSYAVYALPEDPELPFMAQEIDFDGVITLVGYNTLLAPDRGSLQLVTIWRVDDLLPADLAAFIHLKDEEGELISQHAGFDAAPETLMSRDLVIQRHLLPLGAKLFEGLYSLHIGLYTRTDGQRLEPVGSSSEMTDQIAFPLELSFNK